jgi:hypothetical protein
VHIVARPIGDDGAERLRGNFPFVMRISNLRLLATITLLAPPFFVACGSSDSSNFTGGGGVDASAPDDGGSNVGDTSFGGDGAMLGGHTVVSLAIQPATASIESLNGAAASQQFTAVATLDNATTVNVTSATWSRDNPQVGAIGGTGLYTADGSVGGLVNVTATYMGQTATAALAVKLHLVQNPGNVSGSVQTSLTGATTPDASVVWAYPYDATVFPRGVGEAPLMWMNGGASDDYYVHLTSPTFELETYAAAPMSRYDFDAATWQEFGDSTTGAAELKVARWNGSAASIIVDQHWSVAAGSMRGTIYYWAINTGRVMRIQSGATTPDDFIGASVTCPSCHTVAANGQHLLMNEGSWPSETSFNYDLQSSSNTFSGYAVTTGASQWALPGVSPDGTVIVENFAPLRGNIGVQTGAFDSTTSTQIPSTGLEGNQLWMPAFSPDGQLIAYVDSTTSDLRAYDWDATNKKATNDRLIVASASNSAAPQIQFPTVSPDHQWIVYHRGPSLGSLGIPGDMYAASVATPGTEIALDALNGATYPFAAGTRDRHLDFEPTFAPVAAGGYFWVVFHSRRTWGNAITGPAYVAEGDGVKQLWVAAFDQAPTAGTDPSHPAFHLPGQDPTTLNMRGYWALDPCMGNGSGCQSGTECCGGYCGPAPDGGLECSSVSTGCSGDGDRCTTSSDCCAAASGETCINGVCSAPAPR